MGLTAVLAALRCVLAGQGHTVAQNMYAPPFRGSRLAVDGHVLIHRAGQRLINARALVLPRTDSPDAEPLIRSITWMHRQMAERGQLKTQTVFDGAAPPGKNAEKATRREKASDALERVRASQAAGEEPEDKDVLAAAPCFFTAELVADVVDSLHAAGHTARVALTEADGQLAQLAKSGQVDHVLTCDSDLIAHGCPSVLLIPASGRQSHQQPDWLDWQTGGVVHHYQLSVLCSCNLAPEQLAAKQPKPKATETAGLALWLAAILAKHGPVALQVYGALTGCDYGSVCGAGPAVATAALHNLSALGNIEELSKAVSRALGPGYRARILHELEKEVHGPEAAAPAAGGPEAAAPAIALTVRRTLVCFGDALVYDQRPSVKRVVSLRAVAAAITAGGVDALPAVLDRDEHARARADLGGLSINDLVGEAPTDRVAGEIAANRTIPGSLAVRVPYWEDDTLHTAMLTDDLIPGARLQPPVFGKQWADLSDEEQEHVQMLDLDEESWATRFEKERWKSWDDLNEEAGNGCPDSARVLATASDLGFTEAVLWPPRPCDSAAAIEEHFIVDRLDRFLKCRDVKGMSTQSKRNKAEMVHCTMQQEAATLAKDEDVHLVSPEGADYVTLAGAAGRLDPAKFARATLQPPAAGQHWKTDRQEISGQCAYLGEEQVFGEWNGDPECGGEESREIDDGYNAIANLQDPDAEGLRWCKDPSDDQREWFVRQALASMKTEEGALLRYSCFLCVECVPVEQDDEMQVPTSRRFVTWGCECDAGRDLCLHVRGTAMLVAGLPRPAALRVPMGSTFGKNGWKRPGDGTCYSITSFYKNRPFIDSRLRKERRRQDKQKSKGERAVCKPVAMMDFYEPSPDDFPFPAWSAPQLVEMRGELWSGCKHPRLGICAAERLYRGRMPEESASAEVRAEGQRLREFWTTEDQAASQATARREAASAAGRPRLKNNGNRRHGKLSDEDALYMLTRVMRTGASIEQVAPDFGVGVDAATRAFKSTAKGLSKMLTAEYPRPTWGEVRESTPTCFDKKAGTTDTGLMVDATGVKAHHPSNPQMARTLWSDYYEMYAIIYQIGVTPGGCCIWVGPGQSPKLSDTQQCVLAGLLEFLWPESRLLLDRGYKGMHWPARRKKVKVTMPFFRIRKKKKRDKRKQLGREAMRPSKRAAKNRAHNERQMSRLKAFRMFRTVVPTLFNEIMDDLVWIAVCLGNLKCPLVETDAWQVETAEAIEAMEVEATAIAEAAAEIREARGGRAAMEVEEEAGEVAEEEEVEEEEGDEEEDDLDLDLDLDDGVDWS